MATWFLTPTDPRPWWRRGLAWAFPSPPYVIPPTPGAVVCLTVSLGWSDRMRLLGAGRLRLRMMLDHARDPGAVWTRDVQVWPLAPGEP